MTWLALLATSLAQPDVLVFVLDTTRADHISPQLTPNVWAIGERGTRFEHAYAVSSWTPPGVMSLMTGQYATTHGVVEGPIPSRARAIEEGRQVLPLPVLDEATPTLAEQFRDAGYQTAGITTNHIIEGQQGYRRGFQIYEKLGEPHSIRHEGEKIEQDPAWSLEARGMAPAPAEVVHEHVTAWKDRLDADPRPDFVWIHLMDAHMPYNERSGATGDMQSAYRSELAYMDGWIGRIVADLEMEDAIVVVVSDHGEAFGEHGHYGHKGKTRLWAEVNDAVWMMAGPGVPTGLVTEPVSQIDVGPTLLALAGVEALPAPDGVDVFAPMPARTIHAYRGGLKNRTQGTWMAVSGDRKLMRYGDTTLVYALDDESVALDEDAPQLSEALEAYRASVEPRTAPQVEIAADADTLEALKALGYLD